MIGPGDKHWDDVARIASLATAAATDDHVFAINAMKASSASGVGLLAMPS